MLALKGLGCLLIVLSGYVFSRSRLMRESVSIGRLRSLKELLRAIGSRIENYCMPTDEILSELPPELFYSCGYDPERLPESIDSLMEECPFSEDGEVYSFFFGYFSSLGTSYKAEEIVRCRLACDDVSAIIDRRCAENGKRQKTLPVLSLCVSLIIAIIII